MYEKKHINLEQRNEEVKLLIKKAQKCDKEALETLFLEFDNLLHSLFRRLRNKNIDDNDLQQYIKISFLEAIMDYDNNLDPFPIRHLDARTKHKVWNYYRKEMNTKLKLLFYPLHLEETLSEKVTSALIVDNTKNIINNLFVQQAVDSLSETHKKIIYLYYFLGFNEYEIADILDMTQTTVHRNKITALESLRLAITDAN